MNAIDQIRQVTHAMRVLDNIRRDQMPLTEMGVTQQTREISYYFLNDIGKYDAKKSNALRAALNDWLSPEKVYLAYKAADGTELLELIHKALVNGLSDAIDKENERAA